MDVPEQNTKPVPQWILDACERSKSYIEAGRVVDIEVVLSEMDERIANYEAERALRNVGVMPAR